MRVTWAFVLFILCLYIVPEAQAQEWVGSVRGDHPRLFFNRDTWPDVKARSQGVEREWYTALKKEVAGYPVHVEHEHTGLSEADSLGSDGSIVVVKRQKPRMWGRQAARAAFVYRMERDPKQLELAVNMMDVSVEAYNECIAKNMAVDWYFTGRLHWLMAWDWLYEDMDADTRNSLMRRFLEHVDSVRPRPDRPPIHRLNDSNHTTGFYGDRNLCWFAGLAALGCGADDDLARELLVEGHGYNMDLIKYRAECAGDDGGLASATTTYAIAHYPWSQINFFLTWRSATGEDIASQYPYFAYFPVWIMWNWLPGPYPREFGAGDVYHYDNHLWVENLYTHMSQFMDFYGRSEPECAALAAHIRMLIPEKHRRHNRVWFHYPFLLTNIGKAPKPKGPHDGGLHARHFETLGQVFMRSGSGPDDTYALFTVGSRVPSHKQYDENNFIIYKKGYLAMDTGTRGQSTSYQLQHYYAQTVAHNCVLIHQPDEPFAPHWGMRSDAPEGKLSHGGMNKPNGGVCRAFVTKDRYTYVCGDATACYSAEKCAQALRQFVFVYPDWFVICDRVTSTDASYKKEWLLHTQEEPEMIDDMTFTAAHEDGRLFCTTIYPEDAELKTVGGPGMEFWAAGKNWPLAPETKQRADERHNGGLFGNWRVEVSPGEKRKEDVFVHFIQVGDREMQRPAPASLVEENGSVGVRFFTDTDIVNVTFATDGDPGGHISVASGTKLYLDEDLPTTVQPQSGLAGK